MVRLYSEVEGNGGRHGGRYGSAVKMVQCLCERWQCKE